MEVNNFKFPNGESVVFELGNCNSLLDLKKIHFYGKTKWFKGSCKAMVFKNKHDDLDGIVLKIKNNFGKIYYLAVNQEKVYLRMSVSKCFELIPTLKKDKSLRIKAVMNLKV
jgi:hypothetical protein